MAKALVNRGVTWGQKGETDKKLADYTRVIEQLPGAPVEQVAMALNGRGWEKYRRSEYADFLADIEAATRLDSSLGSAAFNLGLALLACERDSDAVIAYTQAADRFPEAIASDGLPGLEAAQKTWLASDRAEPILKVLKARMPDQQPGVE